MTQPNSSPPLAGVEAALLRSAARARVVAQQTQTPLVVLKDGRIERQIPGDDAPTSDSGDSPLLRALDAIGIVGGIETDEQLSTTYKQKLDFSGKCGGQP